MIGPGLRFFIFSVVIAMGVCTSAIGVISCSNVYIQLPRILAIAQGSLDLSLAFIRDVQNFLLTFMGTDGILESSNPELGILGERSSSVVLPLLAARDNFDRISAVLKTDLEVMKQNFKRFQNDQFAFYPATSQYVVDQGVKKIEVLERRLNAIPPLKMKIPNHGRHVFATAYTNMKVAYTNMELVSRILSPQQSDIAHINNTLVHSHRVFNAGLQIYFVLAIFILLSAGTNLVLCNAKAWFILYGLVAFMCLSSWCLLGAAFPQAVVLDAICKNLNRTSGHIGEPLLHTLLTREVNLSRSSQTPIDHFTLRLSAGCLETTAENSTATLFHVLGLEPEIILSTFAAFRLDTQFDTAKALSLNDEYSSYSDMANPDLKEIYDISGLKDMLIPQGSGPAPCSDITLSYCVQMASSCSFFNYDDEISAFSFNCLRIDCLTSSCDACQQQCQCCDLLVQLTRIKSQAKEHTVTLKKLQGVLAELRRNLTLELDATNTRSLQALLNQTQSYLESLDESCKQPHGLAEMYHELRARLCDNMLIDNDIQWFCLGLLTLVFTPWFSMLILGMQQQHLGEKDQTQGEFLGIQGPIRPQLPQEAPRFVERRQDLISPYLQIEQQNDDVHVNATNVQVKLFAHPDTSDADNKGEGTVQLDMHLGNQNTERRPEQPHGVALSFGVPRKIVSIPVSGEI